MKKILFVIPRLGGGGAERVMTNIIRYLSQFPKYKIILIIFQISNNSYLDELPDNVSIESLGTSGRIRHSAVKLIKAIYKLKPDVCFTGLVNFNLFLSFFIKFFKFKGIKFISRETNILSYRISNHKTTFKILYKIFYNQFDRVIAQSDDMKNDLIVNWHVKKFKIIKINNPVDLSFIEKKILSIPEINKEIKIKYFIMLGRLTYQKGYDILLERLASYNSSVPYHITIYGKGDLKKELQDAITNYELHNTVKLGGYCSNSYMELQKCDGLILSSRFEGFPNVLLEANALGKPVFVNNCPGGINEIVKDGINGIVSDFTDQQSFDSGMDMFLTHDFDSAEIRRLTESRYSSKVIMPQYKEVFDYILDC